MPFVVALVVIGALLAFTFYAVAREPGVGPGETAVAYEEALGRGDLSTVIALSDESMLVGHGREEIEAEMRAPSEDVRLDAPRSNSLGVESVAESGGKAMVVTRSVAGDGASRSEVALSRTNGRWRVTGISRGAGRTPPPAE